MQGEKIRGLCENNDASQMNLVITLPRASSLPWLPMSRRYDAVRSTKGLLATLFKASTWSQKKPPKKGSLSHVSLPAQQYQNIWNWKHSVKSRKADQDMLRFSVLGWVGMSGEWQMVSITRHSSLKLVEQSIFSDVRITFLSLNSCLISTSSCAYG